MHSPSSSSLHSFIRPTVQGGRSFCFSALKRPACCTIVAHSEKTRAALRSPLDLGEHFMTSACLVSCITLTERRILIR
ncbi:unnamed protein product [Cylicocyclus nassatus]|uniref:Uncharacterized protein n=1 Tax=Cylicocyclus nassatus TaxID=53992 RepID=A0AA36GP84_CYLNA|nr:unnamed protein product [Cylicocyclus nassatus]